MAKQKVIPAVVLFFALSGAVWAQNDGRGRATDALSRMGQADTQMQAAADEYSPEDEYTIGRAVGVQVLGRYQPFRGNAALLQYLNRICEAIVVNSPNPSLYNGYHVLILDSAQINAYATSGGHIFVTRGLIACAESEDILAAVLAHEIAHIQLKHSIDAIKNARTVQQLRAVGNDAARQAAQFQSLDERRQAFDASIRAAVDTMIDNGYSQAQEFEADTLAITLLARAGYQPSSMVDMLRVLEQRQGAGAGGFNTTHPTPRLRINNATQALRSMQAPTDTRRFRQGRFQSTAR
jgi:predicted Zn-dependent protease